MKIINFFALCAAFGTFCAQGMEKQPKMVDIENEFLFPDTDTLKKTLDLGAFYNDTFRDLIIKRVANKKLSATEILIILNTYMIPSEYKMDISKALKNSAKSVVPYKIPNLYNTDL